MFLACWLYLLMEWGSSPLQCGQSKSSLLRWEKENTRRQQADRKRRVLMNLRFQHADETFGSKCREGRDECGAKRNSRPHWWVFFLFFFNRQPTYLVPHGTFFTSSVCSVVCESKTKGSRQTRRYSCSLSAGTHAWHHCGNTTRRWEKIHQLRTHAATRGSGPSHEVQHNAAPYETGAPHQTRRAGGGLRLVPLHLKKL